MDYEDKIADLERRVEKIEDAQNEKWDSLWKAVSDLNAKLANLNGRLAGYLLAAGLLGAVVAVIAQVALGHIRDDRFVTPADVQHALKGP